MDRVWILETDESDHFVFKDIEKAKDFAYDLLVRWDYDPQNDEYGVFKELEETYDNKHCSGFWIEEVLWCYEVDFYE